jgi:hypothetical protein
VSTIGRRVSDIATMVSIKHIFLPEKSYLIFLRYSEGREVDPGVPSCHLSLYW